MFATVPGLITKGRDRNAAVHRPQKWLCSAGLFGVKQGVAAAHAEVRKQHTPIIKVDQEVFGTPTDVDDGGPREGCQIFRKRVSKAFAANQDVVEGSVQHPSHQPLPDGFYLGKLGHVHAPCLRTTKRRWLSS